MESASPEVHSTSNIHLQASGSELPVQRNIVANGPSEIVKRMQLEALASSTEVRNILKDVSIQDLVCKIDRSADAKTELDKAMSDEAFCLFTEKILAIFGP